MVPRPLLVVRGSYWALLGACAPIVVLFALASILPAPTGASDDAPTRSATVAALTTRDFRIAVVARRLDGGGTPAAEVRVGLARRAGRSWQELRESRLGETFFWQTVTGPRAVCRLAMATTGSSPSFDPYVTVRLLVSPSLGCSRTYRLPLPRR